MLNRWFLGGVGFLIVLSVACVLWYQHDIAPEKKAAADAEELLRQSQIAKKTSETDSEAEKVDDASLESSTPTAEKPITERTVPADAKDVVLGEPQSGAAGMLSVENTEPVRVSPHGFGPYPEIPEGAPIAPFEESDDVDMELLGRVMVKAWNEGERFEGAILDSDSGKVYLNYHDVIYVEYSEDIDELTGEKEIYVSGLTATDSLSDTIAESILAGKKPPTGYRLINYEEAGINPYQYLDLP